MTSLPTRSETRIALLRGLNVSAKNRLPMADLVTLFVDAGCMEVRTYIQSGNVVFRADDQQADGLAAFLAMRITERFGLHVPVVLRTCNDLKAVVTGNPFLAAGADPATLHVMFLADLPAPDRHAALDPGRSPPDAFAVRGSEVYLHLPSGVANSRLTNDYFDRTLGTTSTSRNWRTVLALLQLASS